MAAEYIMWLRGVFLAKGLGSSETSSDSSKMDDLIADSVDALNSLSSISVWLSWNSEWSVNKVPFLY